MTTVIKELGGQDEPKRTAILVDIKYALDPDKELTLDDVLFGVDQQLSPLDIAELVLNQYAFKPQTDIYGWGAAYEAVSAAIDGYPLDDNDRNELQALNKRFEDTKSFAEIAYEMGQTALCAPDTNQDGTTENDQYASSYTEAEIEAVLALNPRLRKAVEFILDPDLNIDLAIADIQEAYRDSDVLLDAPTHNQQIKIHTARVILFDAVVKRLTHIIATNHTPDTLDGVHQTIKTYAPTPALLLRARAHFDKYLVQCVANLPPEEQKSAIEQYSSTFGRQEGMIAQLHI